MVLDADDGPDVDLEIVLAEAVKARGRLYKLSAAKVSVDLFSS